MKTYLAPVLLVASLAFTGCAGEDGYEANPNTGARSGTTSKPSTEPPKAPDATKSEAPATRDVSVAEAAELVAQDDSIVVLDIRTPGEFAEGHIKGAINIDYQAADFATKIGALDKTKTYLMHCRSGGRSSRSMPKFGELGFKSILHLKDGLNGWTAAGHPVEK